ncbi:MAG: multicopper oxidase domain-containing protein [Chloroflexi bacterium]|nr:multicopper oxidase domain-containing protein [Chloroflexota bacterium]MBI3732293.1 multicopper oxidase domain-containing protein [Chloroflexota bacterium]
MKSVATAAVVVAILLFLTVMASPRASVTPAAAQAGGAVSAPVSAPAAKSVPAATPSAPHHVMSPALAPASSEKTKKITIEIKDARIEIAPGVVADMWTYDGQVPGTALHVRQGDTVEFTLVNHGNTSHSIDFHAAQTPWNINYRSINAGETLQFTWVASYPGVFMYHCGTAPVLQHLASGMYGAIVVDPAEGMPKADHEYVLVQSEFYVNKDDKGLFQTDYVKATKGDPDYVVFNGFANQYASEPLAANPGERIRLYVMNAGPTTTSAFHVIGAIFDKVYPGNNPKNAISGEQTYNIPPGGGATFDLIIPEKGLYPFVTHSFASTGKGALGLINVGNVPVPGAASH